MNQICYENVHESIIDINIYAKSHSTPENLYQG